MNAIVKTFRAADPRSALMAVKAALGEDAVIIGSREIGGGLFGRAEIEITAAGSGREELAHPAPALEGEVAALRRIVDELRSELRANKPEPRGTRPEGLSQHALTLGRRLQQRGVDGGIADELVRQAVRDAVSSREQDLLDATRALVRKRLPPAPPPWERAAKRDGGRVLALVGPTGVGKTTTTAKIAARAVLEGRLKVSLVTVDTYRIGASEHIGRYGEIMGVPTHVARDAAGLRDALQRSAGADLVLVDTAGRSDAAAIATQMDLLRAVPDIEFHLCLSAASGAREIRAAARRYERFEMDRIIFTKLDEADGPGSVLSAAAAIPAPVSCIADGQRVPDDLHAVTGPELVDMVVGR